MRDDIVVNQSPVASQYMPPISTTPTGRVAPTVPNPNGAPIGVAETSSNKLNKKQILLQQNFDLKRKYESMVLEWIEILCDPVSEATLGEAANRLKQSHYQEVIEERKIGNLCGYPLCSRPPRDIKGKFRISLSERKVFDISVLKLYCSSTCLAASRWLEGQLTEEPLYLNNSDPESLKVTRVSIVPLDMDLAEFQASRTPVAPRQEPAEGLPAFNLPSHGLQNVAAKASSTASFPLAAIGSASLSSPSAAGNAYVHSLLATVPTTPSFIKIVEHETSDVAPGEPLDLSAMSRDMHSVFGHGPESTEAQYEIVEGFRVPITAKRQNKTAVSHKFHYHSDTSMLEDQMAEVNLSDRKLS
ncbi:RNA polymerase II associated protein 2 [Podila minutissima]|uniref:RNA polymerase II subunit B1 CTD phosphatase RPAP2 homolog n=1 Tax=Podila minutissima TaxID=64525 RepID=A0A9P5SJ93_9FUNG|nr:RNA polymerase II associated protein 2 [Podila minutissima]